MRRTDRNREQERMRREKKIEVTTDERRAEESLVEEHRREKDRMEE